MGTTTTEPLPATARHIRPRTILLYVLLQSLAAGFSAFPTAQLVQGITNLACIQGSRAPPQPPPIGECSALDKWRELCLFYGVMGVAAVMALGPLARLLDSSRRKVMMASALMNAFADLCLYFAAPYALLYQTTHLGLMMASAISKGLAGGTIVLQAAHWTLLADVTSTNAKWRSTYTGMALLTRLFGFKAAGWIVAMFQDAMGAEQQAALIASCIWVAYVVAVEEWYHPDLVLVDDEAEPWACTLILRSIAGPILAMFQNATTILLATSYLCAQLAICIVENMVASMLMRGYADSMPKYTSEALGLLRGAMVCALLALFVLVIHRYRVEEGQSTPLNKDAPELSTKQTFLWTQELSGSQFGFLVGMTSILVCMLSEASVQFILAELSVFVLPSLITMVTFTAEPSRLGTVLTGFALVERFTTAVTKSLPVFLMRSGIFFGHHPRTLWYIAMTFFATGGVLTMFVKRTSRKA